MFNLLFAKTFLIVGGMLVITTFFSRINKAYETTSEAIITIIGSFIFLFAIMFFDDSFPLNIILVSIFSGFIGWSIGPTISVLGESFKMKKYKKQAGLLSKTVVTEKKTATEKFFGAEDKKKTMFYEKSNPLELFDSESEKYKLLIEEIRSSNDFKKDNYHQEWQNVVFQAMTGTTLAVIIAGTIVALIPTDFSFLGIFLWISLLALIFMEILNAFVFKSERRRLLYSYAGVVIFSLYLIYDFNALEKAIARGDNSWGTAVDIAVNLYLDIINLFIDLLEILAASD